jgi:hypothetical protein
MDGPGGFGPQLALSWSDRATGPTRYASARRVTLRLAISATSEVRVHAISTHGAHQARTRVASQ